MIDYPLISKKDSDLKVFKLAYLRMIDDLWVYSFNWVAQLDSF